MFEDSLMESQNRLSSPNQRWTTLASLTLQCALAATLIALPLLHPEVLPFRVDAPTIALPLKPVPPRVPHIDTKPASAPSTSPAAAPAAGTTRLNLGHLPTLDRTTSDAPAWNNSLTGMADPNAVPGGIGTNASTSATRVTLAPAPSSGPVHVSSGVSTGLLLAQILPVYPPIAITTRTEGTVVVEAIISKAGRIESAHVTAGPALLRQAALDAIRKARYSPYLLNGAPTEVATTITVNFRLAG